MALARLFTLAALASPAAAETFTSELGSTEVVQYDGPTECSRKSVDGDYMKAHFTGTIDKSSPTGEVGMVFDTTIGKRHGPGGPGVNFRLGQGRVIAAWELGLLGLCVGAKVTMVAPAELAYGEKGSSAARGMPKEATIPGGATLHFDIEVVDVSEENVDPRSRPRPTPWQESDTNADGELTFEEAAAWFQNKPNPEEMKPEFFTTHDKDGDGIIQWDEFPGRKGRACVGDKCRGPKKQEL